MKEEINKLKAEIFDILRKQEELMAYVNALNTQKAEKLKMLQEMEKNEVQN